MGDTQRQINQLREQVETLMRERVTPAVTDVAGRADRALSAAREQAEAVSGQVEERPLLAILVAVGISDLLARVFYQRGQSAYAKKCSSRAVGAHAHGRRSRPMWRKVCGCSHASQIGRLPES